MPYTCDGAIEGTSRQRIAGSIAVPVVDIWTVSMSVSQLLVLVRMSMRLHSLPVPVFVLVVPVVNVAMFMAHPFVLVPVLVPLDQMQVQTDAHERGGHHEPARHRFAERQDRDRSPGERSEREVGAGPRRTHLTESSCVCTIGIIMQYGWQLKSLQHADARPPLAATVGPKRQELDRRRHRFGLPLL